MWFVLIKIWLKIIMIVLICVGTVTVHGVFCRLGFQM